MESMHPKTSTPSGDGEGTAERKKLVLGLGETLLWQIRRDFPESERKNVYERVISCFDNDFLIATTDMTFASIDAFVRINCPDRIYLDSGGFTLYRQEKKYGPSSPIFKQKCEHMRKKFLSILGKLKVKECFELDNEYFRVDEDILSPRNYLREDVKKITGYYPTPVFKLHQGFEYWKKLCECDLYPRISVGGLAQTCEWHTIIDELRLMVRYAHLCGKKVHLLGCQNVSVFKNAGPDSVDYNVCQFALNMAHARKMNPELKTIQELYKHVSMYGIARGICKSFLYNSTQKGFDELKK